MSPKRSPSPRSSANQTLMRKKARRSPKRILTRIRRKQTRRMFLLLTLPPMMRRILRRRVAVLNLNLIKAKRNLLLRPNKKLVLSEAMKRRKSLGLQIPQDN